MPRRSVWGTGPASSTGSPMTLMMRPSVPSPTGTEIGWPVSATSWPRTRPSVESIAIVRTEFTPRCWATSRISRWSRFLVSSALRIAGRWPSNCTSTTAPMTWRTRPITLVAIVPVSYFFAFLGRCWTVADARSNLHDFVLQRLGAGDDLDQFLGDIRLAQAIVAQVQLVDHLAGVARGAVHGAHARALLGGGVFQEPAEDLRGDVARQQIAQDLAFLGLVLVDSCRFRLSGGACAIGQLHRNE